MPSIFPLPVIDIKSCLIINFQSIDLLPANIVHFRVTSSILKYNNVAADHFVKLILTKF